MITIIPDIHGRVFWKKAVDSASKDDTIVFLGDYLDMYWVDSIVHDITNESTLENFREILEFKKSNPERVYYFLGIMIANTCTAGMSVTAVATEITTTPFRACSVKIGNSSEWLGTRPSGAYAMYSAMLDSALNG